MHLHDRVEVFGRHREHHLVAQDAGVVDQHVEATERVDRGADDVLGAVEVGDAVVVGDGLAAALVDDLDDLVGGALVGALAAHRSTEIVHHDLGAVVGEHDRFAASDTVARTGDDGHLAVEHAHLRVPPAEKKTDVRVTVARAEKRAPRGTRSAWDACRTRSRSSPAPARASVWRTRNGFSTRVRRSSSPRSTRSARPRG